MLSSALWAGTVGLSLLSVLFLSRHGRVKRKDESRKRKERKGPSLIVCTTRHARFKPVLHAFVYPVVYLGTWLDEGHTNLLFTDEEQRWRPLRIASDDYLTSSSSRSIKQKLFDVLRRHGEDTDKIGRVYFVTTPRLFGYAFNPVSFYFCYARPVPSPTTKGQECELLTVVLEVNNTFGEKHVYVLGPDETTEQATRRGYTRAWTFDRRFHVSPFNDRQGRYRLQCRDPASLPQKLDMHLTLLDVDGSKKLTAQVGSVSAFVSTDDILSCLWILIRHGAAVFLTVPRILRQAYTLHYAKKLAVYLRPEPLSDLPGALRRQAIAGSDAIFRDIVVQYLASTGREIEIVSVPTEETILIGADGHVQTVSHATREDVDTKERPKDVVVMTVWANSFWSALVTSPSAVHCLLTDSLSLLPAASPVFTVQNRDAFLDLFDRPIPGGGKGETFLDRQRWACRGPPEEYTLPADLKAYAHLSNRPIDASVTGSRIAYTTTVLFALWSTAAGNALFERIATFAGAAGRPGDAWLRVANTVQHD